jgi:hypothetical protein
MTQKPGSHSATAPDASTPTASADGATPLFQRIKLGSHSVDVTPESKRIDLGPRFHDVTSESGKIAIVGAENFRRKK